MSYYSHLSQNKHAAATCISVAGLFATHDWNPQVPAKGLGGMPVTDPSIQRMNGFEKGDLSGRWNFRTCEEKKGVLSS